MKQPSLDDSSMQRTAAKGNRRSELCRGDWAPVCEALDGLVPHRNCSRQAFLRCMHVDFGGIYMYAFSVSPFQTLVGILKMRAVAQLTCGDKNNASMTSNFELAISQCLTDITLIVGLVVPETSSDTWQGIVVAQQSPPLFLRREAG